MTDDTEAVHPGASRIYETSAGLLHVRFSTDSVVLTLLTHGWFRLFGAGDQVAASAAPLVHTLTAISVPPGEAESLARRMLEDVEQLTTPPARTRIQGLKDVVSFGRMTLDLLVATPRFLWEVLREREDPSVSESEDERVLPGSKEYGVARVVETSKGRFEFDFWADAEPMTIGVYRADGWLRLRDCRPLGQTDLARALADRGLATGEAEQVARLVLDERRARIKPIT